MADRILVLDGATGTALQSLELRPDDFGAVELEGCNEALVLSRPEIILGVHRRYLDAGADLIETDTFGGTPLVLDEYGLGERAEEINRLAAELAREAADGASTPARPRFVVGSMGPTTKAISVTGGITFRELEAAFLVQARGLLAGGVDLFAVETCQDTRTTKAALLAVHEAMDEAGVRRPILVSGTIEPTGTLLAGQNAEAFLVSVEHEPLLAIGLNCATGPEFMTDHLRAMQSLAPWGICCYPNAGLPRPDGSYPLGAEDLASALERFVDRGWLNIVGGCCGTHPGHVRSIASMVEGRRPRPIPWRHTGRSFYTGIELVEATEDTRPLLVGERSNVIGSRRFRRLVAEERWEEAAEVARAQVDAGAQIVDVCLESTERDELADVRELYERLIRTVKAPLMVDSTDPEAIEEALTYCQGKSIVNSVNLEDGTARFDAVCPLLRRYGAAVVVGAIDEDPEQAQAFTRERKLEVALRSHALLTEAYGIAEHDIVVDPLVFPAASGDEGYVGGAVETLEGLRLVKAELPGVRTILGISNVSFGLPAAAREVVNSVFLHLATRAGLDLAIVNSEGIERYASIPEADRELAENLLLNRPPREGPLAEAPEDWRRQSLEQRATINRLHIARLVQRFRGETSRASRAPLADLPVDERVTRRVVEGRRDGLVRDLDELLSTGSAPLAIINGPLMVGMAEVGRLFDANQLIVAEVLKSAEVMKAAVSHLEAFMDAADVPVRARVLLATVKGDVHDIGKNLVQILLANNGFDVVDLGIRVPPGVLVQAARGHRPDAIGLSGLLVKSAQQMVATAEDLRAAGVDVPLLVGGAALSGTFARQRIAPAYGGPVLYCSDAMAGLDTVQALCDPERRPELLARMEPVGADRAEPAAETAGARGGRRSREISTDVPPLPPPRPDRVVERVALGVREAWPWVNPQMLYGKHLGFRGGFEKAVAAGDERALKLAGAVARAREQADWIHVSAVWRFFEAEADGSRLLVYEAGGDSPVATFDFPRQPREDGLCLADYVVPPRDGVRDSVAAFVVTAGEGVRERSKVARDDGELLASHVIQALAVETAEAAAEWLHARLRALWGFPDPEGMTMKDRFAARYRGKRYSFGYPACPDLDHQATLWPLLEPGEIGVELTEGMMMDPEASVSALVFHHPEARYFSASGTR